MLPYRRYTLLLFLALFTAAPSIWVFRRLELGAWFGSCERRRASLAASQDSAMSVITCGMSCIGSLSRSGSLTGSLSWSGAVSRVWPLFTYRSSLLHHERPAPRFSPFL